MDYFNELNAKEIVKELDKYIIGQDNAKKMVAIALRNRMRRMNVEGDIRDEIIPSNIIMIGPTGVGKTEIARRLAKLVKAPFVKVEATKFTEVGYVGKDVESIIRDLVNISYSIVEKEMAKEVSKAAEKAAEEKILDAILPGSEKAEKETVEKFRDMLERGVLEDREIEVEVMEQSGPKIDIMGIGGMEAFEGIQDMFQNIAPKKKKKKKMKIRHARQIIIENETIKRIDREIVNEKAKERAEQNGIVFIDEIDKVVTSGKYDGVDVSRGGVQRDLLPIVEGTTVTTKYGSVKTDYILFIAAGAFSSVNISDLMPEFQGRFPVRSELNSLTGEEFFRILTEPDNAITKQYQALIKTEGIEVEFDDEALRLIAEKAYSANQKIEDIGARRLRTVITKVLEDIMYNAPDIENKKILIDKNFVEKSLGNIFEDKDLERYIL
ncbi:ATP-dependent protease ATPase subunit HslU [candidate division WOR-3 bacterium]|nr:ATP-dependent protease ATPase subunit HslU [candidate division WOR-3 bacterium]